MFRTLRFPPKAAVIVVVALASACADQNIASITSPVAEAPAANPSYMVGDTLVVDFVVNTTQNNSIMLGDHKLVIPAGTLCDVNSTYGPTEWNKPCVLATGSVAFTAKGWTTSLGTPQVDFSRDVRFVRNRKGELPSISFMDKKSASNPYAKILYCASGASVCVDESASDPELVTRTDARNGFIYRLIKHFSGYNVWA